MYKYSRVVVTLGWAFLLSTSTGCFGLGSSEDVLNLAATTPAATSLSISTIPNDLTEQLPFSSSVRVTVLDQLGNPMTSYTGEVTLALDANSDGASLAGTVTKAAVAGVATFDNLSVSRGGSAFRISATAGSASGQTPAFDVTPGVVIYGQESFSRTAPNAAPASSTTFWRPNQMAKAGTKYFVVDGQSNRVLIFNNSLSNGASVVLGQPDMTSTAANAGSASPSASSLNYPFGVASDGTHLVVSDMSNHRVLIWNSIPAQSFQAADVVIGQADFSSKLANRGGAVAANTLSYPGGVAIIGAKLVVADASNGRVLVWNTIPTSNGAPANAVIGQNNTLNTAETGLAGNRFFWPYCLDTDGTRLLICDSYQQRVLIWDTFPTDGNTMANHVVGADTLTSSGGGTAANRLMYPFSARFTAAGGLYVADSFNNRILYWSSIPADVAVGNATGVITQPNATTGTGNRGGAVAANSSKYPYDVFVDGSHLFVVDTGNNRILEFTSLPISDVAANVVYGQSSMNTASVLGMSASANGFDNPSCLAFTDNHVIVGDTGNSRLLVFNRSARTHKPAAVGVLGQANFTDSGLDRGLGATNAGGFKGNFDFSGSGVSLGCSVDSAGRLYVSDEGNHRVLVFNTIVTDGSATASYVLGQNLMTESTGNSGADGLGWLNRPNSVWATADKLFVGEYWNNRALIFNLPITQNHALASVVVGQPDATTITGGATQSKTSLIQGVYSDGTKLIISDYGNSRFLIYNQIPTSHGAAADFVLGQSDFTSNSYGLSATQFGGAWASGLALIGGFLYIPDAYNNRILGFNVSALTNGMAATRVLGQTDFTSSNDLPVSADGRSFKNLNFPTGIFSDPYAPYVWVLDRSNNRVLRIHQQLFSNYVH